MEFVPFLSISQSPSHPYPRDVRCTTNAVENSIDRVVTSHQEEMEVEGLDGATASLIFFVVVAILVFGCLQVVVGVGGRVLGGGPGLDGGREGYGGMGMVCHKYGEISSVLNCESLGENFTQSGYSHFHYHTYHTSIVLPPCTF